MSYPESVRYLYALGNELAVGAKFGLERIQTVLQALGNPHVGPKYVHVAGTNGKGSTCVMLSSIFQASGLRTGMYTSPHLIEPTERIQIDGAPVSEHDFTAAFERVHSVSEQLLESGRIDRHPSYFETVTAMGFLLLRPCDVSVIEVGLGGRLDATNVITPAISVITPVSYDHEAFLGNTLESIAGEKAGIIKPGVPVVISSQEPVADQVIVQRAAESHSELIRAEAPDNVHIDADGADFKLHGVEYHCGLRGAHQVQNAATAVTAALRLGIATEAIQHGLARAVWPGRLERIRTAPDVFLDGAHNPAGAAALAAYLREFQKGRPIWLIYGAMRDKAIDEVAHHLFPLAAKLILTAPDMPRALRPEAIAGAHEHPDAVIATDLKHALGQAEQAPADALVVVTGSLYLVGEARRLLLK